MGKAIFYFLLAFTMLFALSCRRYVCPAYSGAFLLGQGHKEWYFKYEKDSLPKEDGLWESPSYSKKNGKVKKDLKFRSQQALWDGKRLANWYYSNKKRIFLEENINLNYPRKGVLATIQWPDTAEENIFIDSVIMDTTDVFDQPYVSEDNLQPPPAEDSLAVEADSVASDSIQWPPMRYDQYYYEIGIKALLEADSAANAKADTTNNVEEDTTNYVYLERNDWWKIWKPKTLKLTEAQFDSVNLIYGDSNYMSPKEAKKLAKQAAKEQKQLEKEEAKRLKEEEKEIEEQLEEQEEGADDW